MLPRPLHQWSAQHLQQVLAIVVSSTAVAVNFRSSQDVVAASTASIGLAETRTGLGAGMHTLPVSTGARCLDGSPYSFYVQPGDPSTWSISLEGGEWCHTPENCARRAGTVLGSSRSWPSGRGCVCENFSPEGKERSCTCVYLPYCDGALFAANVEDPVAGWSGDKEFYLRGLRNFEATLDVLQSEFGLGAAKEVILTGHSAGALSSMLHVDRVTKRFGPGAQVRAVALHGFFIDSEFANPRGVQHKASVMMQGIFDLHRLNDTVTAWGAPGCLEQNPSAAHRCLFAEEALPYVATPVFLANSAFDEFQLGNLAGVDCIRVKRNSCTSLERQTIRQFGEDFLQRLRGVIESRPRHAAYVTSCICHNCPWGRLRVGNTSGFNRVVGSWLGANESRMLVDDSSPEEHHETGCDAM